MSSIESDIKKEVNVTADCMINGIQYKCRTCFDPGSQFFSLMEKCSDNKTWQDILNEVVHIMTNDEMSLPKTICSKCLDKLINYYDFILQIQKVNQKYSDLLGNQNCNKQVNVPKKFINFKEYFIEPSTSRSLSQHMSEIKCEDEIAAPFDIVMGRNALHEENEVSLEDKDDACDDTSIDSSDLSGEEFLDEKRSLHEAETNDNFKSDQDESSSSSDEEDDYLSIKRRKRDKPTSLSSYYGNFAKMSGSDSSPILQQHSCNNKTNNKNENKDKKCRFRCEKKIDKLRAAMDRKLNRLEGQMKVMVEAQAEENIFLRNLLKHGDPTVKDARSVFPIETEEDLLSLNEKISSENRVLYVNTIRSYFQPQGVKKNLKYVLSSELVDQYNVDGNHGKKGLKRVDKFFHVLLEAIDISTESDSAEHQLRQAIFLQKKRFLKQKSIKK